MINGSTLGDQQNLESSVKFENVVRRAIKKNMVKPDFCRELDFGKNYHWIFADYLLLCFGRFLKINGK